MRIAKPWYWEYKKGWYIKLNGVQVPLGKHPDDLSPPRKERGEWHPPKEIHAAWHRLMAKEGLVTPPKELTVSGLVEQFLVDSANDVTPETLKWYRRFLGSFTERYPKLKAIDIAPRHIRTWINTGHKKPWGQSTQRSAITIVKRLFNWAASNKLIATNPIADYEKPAATVRDRVLTAEEKAKILSWYPEGDPFRDFLIAMFESGARPSEVIKVTAADVNLDMGVWILVGKTTRRTGKDRIIYMSTALAALTRRLIATRPAGPLFLNEDGNPWNLQSINCRFRRKKNRQKDRLDDDITAYVLRGTFATDALEAGVSDAVVAELLGHSGTAVLHKHYNSLRKKSEHLRKAADQATKK